MKVETDQRNVIRISEFATYKHISTLFDRTNDVYAMMQPIMANSIRNITQSCWKGTCAHNAFHKTFTAYTCKPANPCCWNYFEVV